MYQNLLKGNLVYGTGKFEGVALEVLEISDSSVSLGNENGIIQTCNISEIKPISINSEYLEGLGFEYNNRHRIYIFSEFRAQKLLAQMMRIEIAENIYTIVNYPSGERIKVDYVHELQNYVSIKFLQKLDIC